MQTGRIRRGRESSEGEGGAGELPPEALRTVRFFLHYDAIVTEAAISRRRRLEEGTCSFVLRRLMRRCRVNVRPC